MQLFRQIGRLAHNVVAAVVQSSDIASLVEIDPVAHRHRIGAFDAFDAKRALHLAQHIGAIGRANRVIAPCTFYD